MRQIDANHQVNRLLYRRISPWVLVAAVGIGLAACGSSGGGGSSGVNTGGTGGHQNTPTTVAPKSGGAGF